LPDDTELEAEHLPQWFGKEQTLEAPADGSTIRSA